MKRSTIVLLYVIPAALALVWSVMMAYRIHHALTHRPSAASVGAVAPPTPNIAIAPSSGNTANSAAPHSSPDGLADLRNNPAPAFTLMTPGGKPVSLADYKGKAVLVNFWGTWCEPCKLEIPWLVDLQKKYAAQGFTILGIAENEDSAKNVSDYGAKMHIDYPLLMADDKINKAYSCCDYVPSSYYIGRDGKIVAEVGGIISASDIEANIREILATKGT